MRGDSIRMLQDTRCIMAQGSYQVNGRTVRLKLSREEMDSAQVLQSFPAIEDPLNHSKDCGGVMRVAPLALKYPCIDIRKLDREGAELAAITLAIPSDICRPQCSPTSFTVLSFRRRR